MKNWFLKNKYLTTLIILFLGQFFLISPIGEFPLNDDWVHAEMVQHWADTGSFRLNPYTGPLLYTQLLYGTALTKIFGFSFTLLRFSTLVLMAGIVFGLFYWLKTQTKNESLAFFATLVIWLNPITYEMSFTFMSDVPALAVLLFSLIAFYFGSKKENISLFWLGATCAALGFFIRQTTILILPAIGLTTLIKPSLRKIKYWTAIIIPGLIAVAVYHWLSTHNLIGEGTSYHEIKDKQELIRHAVWWGIYTALYIGLFLLPLTVSLIKKSTLWLYGILGTLGLVLPAWLYFYKKELFPYIPNTINHFGLGPFADTLSGSYVAVLPTWLWLMVSAAAGIGLGFLIATVGSMLKTKTFYVSNHAFILFFALIFTGPILIYTGFDRYFMGLILAGILLICLQNPNTKPNWASWTALIIMVIYTLSQTQFYLNWNRTRAELINLAFAQYDAKIDTLDSGYEWTGYQDYWEAAKIPKVYRWPAGSPWWIRFLMININRAQVISSTPQEGYSILEERLVSGFNPNNHLYLLKKNDAAQGK